MGTTRIAEIRDVVFGKHVKVIEPANLYECMIGDESFVGPFTEIQSGSRIGARCRIQSHTFICSMVSIGDDCSIGHGVMFTNDRYRGGAAKGDHTKLEETVIGKRVSIGSNATILPVKICDDVVIGAGSVVTRDIVAPGTYAGNPARHIPQPH